MCFMSLSDILRFPGDSLTTKLINSTELVACGGFLLSAFGTNRVSRRKFESTRGCRVRRAEWRTRKKWFCLHVWSVRVATEQQSVSSCCLHSLGSWSRQRITLYANQRESTGLARLSVRPQWGGRPPDNSSSSVLKWGEWLTMVDRCGYNPPSFALCDARQLRAFRPPSDHFRNFVTPSTGVKPKIFTL